MKNANTNVDQIWSVQVQVKLGRRILNQAISEFLPSFIICIICYFTNYFEVSFIIIIGRSDVKLIYSNVLATVLRGHNRCKCNVPHYLNHSFHECSWKPPKDRLPKAYWFLVIPAAIEKENKIFDINLIIGLWWAYASRHWSCSCTQYGAFCTAMKTELRWHLRRDMAIWSIGGRHLSGSRSQGSGCQ